MINYILPAVLINIISLFVFCMPSDSGEKITLGISAMLNMTVFLMAVIGDLPPTDKTSIISIYYSVTLIITSATTVTGVLVLQLHFQAGRGVVVPQYLHQAARWMAALSFSKYEKMPSRKKVFNCPINSKK